MSWYRTGTINITKDSASITGINTKWAQAVNGVMPGMMMIMPDNKLYEIKNVVSDTSLVLVTAYTGATAAAQAYSVVTTYEGDLSQFSARFNALLTAMGGSRADMYNWLTSTAATISVAKDDGTTVTVKTLKAFTDEQAKFATKNADGVVPVTQGGTGAKDEAGIRKNAGLRSAAEVDVGIGQNQLPINPGYGYGVHVASMYLDDMTKALRGASSVQDEYMIASRAVGATASTPSGFIGRFIASRGSESSSNSVSITDVTMQTSYSGQAPVVSIINALGQSSIFTETFTATYKGVMYYVFKLSPSGGSYSNGVYFSGLVFRSDAARDIFKVVRSSELADITAFSSGKQKFPVLSTSANIETGTSAGNAMIVGSFGVGGGGEEGLSHQTDKEMLNDMRTRVGGLCTFRQGSGGAVMSAGAYNPTLYWRVGDGNIAMSVGYNNAIPKIFAATTATLSGSGNPAVNTLYGTANTTRGSDGTLKTASPIVKIFHDGKIKTNDESDGCAVTRLGIGQYLIKNCMGMNADASWGGINGGFDIPTDRNGQALIWLDYEVNADGSVLVETYHRTYPDAPIFARNEIDGIADGEPVDIPADQFISVRVEMPQDSIWNQKQEAIQAESEVLHYQDKTPAQEE